MPFNLLKQYNTVLELGSLTPKQREDSLMGIFNRDIVNNPSFTFHEKQIYPTPQENGEISMKNLFTHLSCKIIDEKTREREFDMHRSIRIHWIKYHIDGRKRDNILIYSVQEPHGFRTYIYDISERYVIILEPLRRNNEYYLLTAFYVRGKDAKRNKYEKKYKRRLPNVL